MRMMSHRIDTFNCGIYLIYSVTNSTSFSAMCRVNYGLREFSLSFRDDPIKKSGLAVIPIHLTVQAF